MGRTEEFHAGRGEYFHGTVASLKAGDTILPAERRGYSAHWREGDPSEAYATANEADAWDYAEKVHAHTVNRMRSGPFPVPRVFRVRPLGEVRDASGLPGAWSGDVSTRHGFEVLGEIPLPGHMGDPEDWKV